MSVQHMNAAQFKQAVAEGRAMLLDFYADWCGPCRMLGPVLEEIANERTDLKVVKINVDEEEELANRFGIMSIPTLILFRDGKPVRQSMGVQPKASISCSQHPSMFRPHR